ncbi:MAG: hypothetical protein R2867_37020 [Caldilineaceae bacterium]
MLAAFLIKDYVIKADAIALGIDMELADRIGLIACVRKVCAMVGMSVGMGSNSLKTRSLWVRGGVPVINVRRAGMQTGHSA